MDDAVRLNRLRSVIGPIQYPLSKEEARAQVGDVTLQYADGQEPLGAVLRRSNDDTFERVSDLEAEIYTNVPVEAVGEPGQSEGEG